MSAGASSPAGQRIRTSSVQPSKQHVLNGRGCARTALVVVFTLAGSGLAYPNGAIDPAVTQANIQNTMCRREWVRAARPPVQVTTRIKHRLLARAGVRYSSDFELDHRVPLCLGGAPLDARNLQLQHWGGPWNARCKDALEAELCKAVCAGLESLEDAQSEIMGDWPGSYRDWIDPKGCE